MKGIVFILCLLLSVSSQAGQFATNYGKITYVRAYGDTNTVMPTYIQIEGASIREACSHADFGKGDLNYFLIKPEESHILSIALAAFMAGKEVKVTSNDTPSLMNNNETCRVIYLDVK